MDREVYNRMNQLEAEHWWFVARRLIIQAAITRLAHLPPSARILEAGVGTGGNMTMLQAYGSVRGFEFDSGARKLATEKIGFAIPYGSLPNEIPYQDERFDLICLFDVLEHVERDCESLSSLASRLAPGGRILITVPAYPWLWSKHDESHHHFRRYTRKSFLKTVTRADLKVEYIFNFNFFLMPLILVIRAFKRLSGSRGSDDMMPNPTLNRLLTKIFAAERYFVGRVPMPIGVSLGAVLVRAER